VTRSSRKYVLDTQLFINAFRDPAANAALQQFHRAFSPFEYFSVIVVQELRAGVQRSQDRKALERNVLKVFQRASRTITPSESAWHKSGDLLAEMARQDGLEIARVSKAFANDVLLALPRSRLCARDRQRTGFSTDSTLCSVRLHEALARRSDVLISLNANACCGTKSSQSSSSASRAEFFSKADHQDVATATSSMGG
jgi:predicted nucleic acid-binding protein